MNKPILRLLLSLMFSLGLGCFVERSIFGNPFALNDDVRNQVYWMARIFDPTLFPQDFIADYFTQPLLVSPILHGIYSFFSLGVNPIVLTQFLPFALVILATLFLFKFAERYQDASYAFWTCFSFNCSIWIFKNLSGGLSRAFFYPLFFLLLWSLYTAQWRYVALTLWLSTLIYPPAFFLGLVLLLIEMWVHRHQEAERSNRIKCFFWSLGGSLMLVAGRLYMFPHEEKFGALTTHFKAEGMRFFYKGGRIVLFPFNHEPLDLSFPFNWLGEVVERIPNLYILIPTLIFAVLLFLYNRFLKVRLGDLMIPALVWRVMIS